MFTTAPPRPEFGTAVFQPSAATQGAKSHDGVEPGSKLLLTVVEAAERLGIGRTLMYELVSSGQIDSLHVGRLHRIPFDALTDFIARQRTRGDRAL